MLDVTNWMSAKYFEIKAAASMFIISELNRLSCIHAVRVFLTVFVDFSLSISQFFHYYYDDYLITYCVLIELRYIYCYLFHHLWGKQKSANFDCRFALQVVQYTFVLLILCKIKKNQGGKQRKWTPFSNRKGYQHFDEWKKFDLAKSARWHTFCYY